MSEEEKYMTRALELAETGRGSVSPNPMVGCVIVRDNQIIGEGWHRRFGEAHAEVNAVNSVQDKSLLAGADVYVSLEPCAHYGKTPPCADLLAGLPLKRVIVAIQDPNPVVAGKGITKIKSAGIEVVEGVLEYEAAQLNRRFLTMIKQQRPYIILKWAQTADGFIARKDGSSKWISNDLSRKLVHKWRSEEDAILVGRKTAEVDNPRLNTREWKGKDPLRIVIDSQCKLPPDLYLFDQSGETLIYNCHKNAEEGKNKFIKLNGSEGFLEEMMQDLYQKKTQSVLVEGGTMILQSFLRQHLWDEIRLFKSRTRFGNGIQAPAVFLEADEVHSIEDDNLEIFYNRQF